MLNSTNIFIEETKSPAINRAFLVNQTQQNSNLIEDSFDTD